MNPYDSFAALYEIDMGDKADDIPLYLRYAQMQGSPILELACGTGRILIPIAKQGFEVYGVDNSPAMLDIARRKIAAIRDLAVGRIILIEEDMQDAGMHPNSPLHRLKFNLVILAFNAFLHLLMRQDQERILENIRQVLSDQGILMIDIFAPHHSIFAQAEGVDKAGSPIRHSRRSGKTYLRTDRVRRNLAEQTQEIDYIYDILQTDGSVERTVHTMRMRYLFRFEMELLLELTGYEVIDLFGEYDGRRYDATSRKMVFVARKSDKAPRHRIYL